MLVYGECECFVMQMLYVCVLCASCGSSQCCVLHDLQFVNAGRGCNRRPYRRGILQSRSHNCFIGSHECLLLFTPSCCGECFYDFLLFLLLLLLFFFLMICRGSNDSRLHVVEPPRRRSFIWQIGVNSSIQDRRQVDRGFLWSRVSCTRQR